MKTASAPLQAHIVQETTTLCRAVLLLSKWRLVEIVAVTNANPGVVTTKQDHTLESGQFVAFKEVAGMLEVNDDPHGVWKLFQVTVTGAKTFEIDADTTSFGAYTSGGKIYLAFGWTDLDEDISIDGMNYKAEASYTPSSSKMAVDGSTDTTDLNGILSENYFSLPDISEGYARAGLYDYSEIRFFKVNWKAPADGKIWMMRGFTGAFQLTDRMYTAEIRGLTKITDRNLLSMYTRECRWESIEDSRCQVDPAAFTYTGAVTSVTDRQTFNIEGDKVYQNFVLQNTGFETGDITGWTEDGATYQAVTSAPHSTDPRTGVYFCEVINAPAGSNYLYQDVDVSAYSGDIDSGDGSVTWPVYVNTPNYKSSTGLKVDFLDGTGTFVSSVDLPLANYGPEYDQEWHLITLTDGVIAPNTRTLRVKLWSSLNIGTVIRCHYDDVGDVSLGYLSARPAGFTEDGFYDYGFVKWTSGDNSGITQQVLRYAKGKFRLMAAAPLPIQIGDSFEAIAGCDKHMETCRTKFDNFLNFGGYPHIPGKDKLMEITKPRKPATSV